MNLCGKDEGKLQQLSTRLKDIHGQMKLNSETKERTISLLKDRNIEIFDSQIDRQTVLYIRCKSHMGHESLRTSLESNAIIDLIRDLTKITPSAPELIGSRMIDIEIEEFKRTIGKL